jgi:demethylmenaquinone methyltransferase/2-methoxy-6-polyprenyl-1,4-benzoquinol methylase
VTDETTLRSYYAARAPEYDRIYDKPERQADLRHLRGWLPSLFAGRRVLEVACGTGYWTQFIAATASTIVAVDAAPETLAIARQRKPMRNVEFVVGDAYDLRPELGAFDAAFAGFWLSHVPRRRQREFFEGLGRALTAGATVALLDNRYVEGSSQPIVEHDEDGNSYQARRLQDGSMHKVLKNFPSEEDLLALVQGSGGEAQVTMLEYYWVLHYTTTTGLRS